MQSRSNFSGTLEGPEAHPHASVAEIAARSSDLPVGAPMFRYGDGIKKLPRSGERFRAAGQGEHGR